MKLSDRQTTRFLFAIQGVGGVFVIIFLAAYLAGLPTTNVLHSEPIFRIPLAILGSVFLALIFLAIILAVLSEKT